MNYSYRISANFDVGAYCHTPRIVQPQGIPLQKRLGHTRTNTDEMIHHRNRTGARSRTLERKFAPIGSGRDPAALDDAALKLENQSIDAVIVANAIARNSERTESHRHAGRGCGGLSGCRSGTRRGGGRFGRHGAAARVYDGRERAGGNGPGGSGMEKATEQSGPPRDQAVSTILNSEYESGVWRDSGSPGGDAHAALYAPV